MGDVLAWEAEPCDTCRYRVAKFTCFDGNRRCQVCIDKLIKENAWNQRVLPPPKRRKRQRGVTNQQTMFSDDDSAGPLL